jgi:prepilin-type N-terminal cleavage/methylation domain-containing protein
MQTLDSKAGRAEGGFTLIELLIVVIVLSVLAGVVLFAVGDARSDAVGSSCKSDVKVIGTAQEAYKAKYGGYGTEANLVADKFMKAESKLFDISLTGGGDKAPGNDFGLVILTQDPASNTCTSTSADAGGGGGGASTTSTTAGIALSHVSGATITCPGVCAAGNTATAVNGNWVGTPPITFTYQWFVNTNANAPCNLSGGGWNLVGTGASMVLPVVSTARSDAVGLRITATNGSASASTVQCSTFDD